MMRLVFLGHAEGFIRAREFFDCCVYNVGDRLAGPDEADALTARSLEILTALLGA